MMPEPAADPHRRQALRRSQISLDQRYHQDRGEVERYNYQDHRQ
jgi:hypothetical protein